MYKTLFSVAIAGFIFSGYMSGVKFFSGACAFNEGCPIFLGYPACYYGFAMFTLITIFSSLLFLKKWNERHALMALFFVSGLGILFAGYYTLGELPLLFREGLGAYLLGLPTCAYGLIVYSAVMVLTLKARRALPTAVETTVSLNE